MKSENLFEIDNITFNDLSLNEIYERFNHCETSAGDDYLYERITHPYIRECEELISYKKLAEEISDLKHKDPLSDYLKSIGRLKKYKFKETLDALSESERMSNTKHYIIDALIIISFMMIFVLPGPGVVAFLVLVGYSVSDYFKAKNIIAERLYVFSYVIRMLKTKLPDVNRLYDAKRITCELSDKLSEINAIKETFRPFMAGTFLISEGARTQSDPLGIVFDYIRMIFHVDIIKYNSMIDFLKSHKDSAVRLYELIGEIDCALAIERELILIREQNKPLCIADTGEFSEFSAEDIYHPLLNNPVANSISCTKNILLTGCNASGKSTFLKCIEINAIFAQSFGFAFAKSYKAPFFRIYSSMAIRDDIISGESYFMAEIKSLKRILDAAEDEGENGNVKILCVIDEVLRGTNTIERICASTEILKSLSRDNVLCFAATHDRELTGLLEAEYDNYHFTEEITDFDVRFNYRLKDGVSSSYNAIRLLKLMGFDESITDAAINRAEQMGMQID